jgi:hypothetical protein
MTLEEKKEMLQELQRAYYSGASRIKFKDREIEYKSQSEMKKVISDLKIEIGEKSKGKRVVATFSKV